MTRVDAIEIAAVSLCTCALAVLIALLLTHCSPTVGPFVPPGSPVCSSDADCPDSQHCAFPAPGWKARCMQGASDVGTIPDEMKRRDGGP